ncbi:hypothetical protein NC796_09510 [Aliifodinibius sp. S!AR15-10]|uniref:hypothetical protein n=1 Tax=Aliifodinibius sp. S!AR15-10 TaxID=2950437 RepID=UPI00285DC267|nr:hypothetical protein [Aliifodinibius sp. S!AR15-10]MDR8391374.1 hypothetical protein [Aliifodinibius sp. S!AR15-10]
MDQYYLEATQESGKAFFSQDIPGEFYMLNLLQFRELANYSEFPNLSPTESISGKQAYQRYMKHTLPLLNAIGSEVVFQGSSGTFLIGPQAEKWDWMLLVRHKSRKAFMGLASNKEYLAGKGHRNAALHDSRLLPIVEGSFAT